LSPTARDADGKNLNRKAAEVAKERKEEFFMDWQQVESWIEDFGSKMPDEKWSVKLLGFSFQHLSLSGFQHLLAKPVEPTARRRGSSEKVTVRVS
jgi:hypothetical protein